MRKAKKRKVNPPDFLVIGHITKDLVPDGGYHWGGTAAYAARTAQRLGKRVAVVTCAGSDPWWEEESGMEIKVIPSASTTTFRNLYTEGGRREQWLRERAESIPVEVVPLAWRKADIVLLGPVAQEVSPEHTRLFADTSLVALSPQGIWRVWDKEGAVRTIPRELEPNWRVQALILSQEDLSESPGVLESLLRSVPVCVVTQGPRGATLYEGGRSFHFPARPARVVRDSTGAGDIFAAAFLVCWRETGDTHQAVAFGNCSASLAIEKGGLAGIPTRQEIEASLSAERQKGPCPLDG